MIEATGTDQIAEHFQVKKLGNELQNAINKAFNGDQIMQNGSAGTETVKERWQ